MTDQEAFEAWFKDQLEQPNSYADSMRVWHAALAYLRSQQKPAGWLSTLSFDGVVADRKVTLLEPRYPFGVPGADFRREGSRVDWYPLYTAPQPAVPDGWKPIETAPKDGREVILAVETRAGIPHGVLVGHYMPGGHCIDDHPPIAAGWYFWNGCMFDKAAKPTHWMEMPHHPKWPADGWQARAQKPSNDQHNRKPRSGCPG